MENTDTFKVNYNTGGIDNINSVVRHNQSYERAVHQNEADKLEYYTTKINNDIEDKADDTHFVNLSVKQILKGISLTFISIINELVSGEIRDVNGLIMSLFKGNRMIFISVILVMIAFSIYLVDITS